MDDTTNTNPSASSGQVPSASSGQVPSTDSASSQQASSGQVPSTDSASSGSMPQNIPIPPEIQAYLESLIAEANVPVTDDKAKDELVRYLFDKLDKFLAAKIVENMTPEDTEAFIKLNEDGKPREEIDAFIKEHMTNPQEVFTRAFIDFRDFYLTGQPAAAK